MNPLILIRRGDGRFWGGLKRLARAFLRVHVPVGPLSRPLFRVLYSFHVSVRTGGLWLLRFLWFEPLFRSQCAAVGRGLTMEFMPFMHGSGRIALGDRVRLAGKSSFMFLNRYDDAPELAVGDHTFLGHDCMIAVGCSVRIGSHSLLADRVRVSDHDGHPIDAKCRRTDPPPREAIKPVVIGDDVWVGAGAIILKGVTIGDRSIVGAGSVVTRSVPSDVVVAGNPARVIKSLFPSGMTRNGAPFSRCAGHEG